MKASITYYYPDLTSQCIFKVRHLPNCMGRAYVGPGSTKPLLIQKWKVWEEITMLFTNALIAMRRVEWEWKLQLTGQGGSWQKQSPERSHNQQGRWLYCCPIGHGEYPSELTCNTWISVDIKLGHETFFFPWFPAAFLVQPHQLIYFYSQKGISFLS